jgi:hypothetical protein
VKNAMKVAGAVAVLFFFMGCTVTVLNPDETKIKAENKLVNLSVDVDGKTTNVEAIDLVYVDIGDVFFSFIQGGTTSIEKTSSSSGKVPILIDTAIVVTKVLGQDIEIPFPNITGMTATITKNTTNTVVFDRSTASEIFSALAKIRVIALDYRNN